ncbi:MAG: hypothetical protein ACRCSF_03310 [Mycobacteriaceae bacterium]
MTNPVAVLLLVASGFFIGGSYATMKSNRLFAGILVALALLALVGAVPRLV